MNSKNPSSNTESTEPAIKAISGAAELHEKSFLEVMDSIPGGDNIEFEPPKLNFTSKPIDFN